MAFRKTRAWVTSALNDDSIEAALVLAESIRRTKTNCLITVITAQNVSVKNRSALRHAFDMVFFLDETYGSNLVLHGKLDDALAKIYAFSLVVFEKCAFVATNSLFLENADNLFDRLNHQLEARVNSKDGSLDLSFFLLEPNKTLYNLFLKTICSNGSKISDIYLNNLLKKQGPALTTGLLPDKTVSDFSVTQARSLSENTSTPVVHFLDDKFGQYLDAENVKRFHVPEMGLRDMIIAEKWLSIYESSVQGFLESDQALNIKHMNFDNNPKQENIKNEPIAIVGMSCRYPGASSLQEFWNLLYAGEEGIREPPAFRWTKEHSVRVTQQDRKSQAGFLSVPVDEFDAKFFGVSPKEAAYMDPQSRLLHEVVWESLEDAGIDPLSLYGTHTGIFTGSWMHDYKDIVASSAEKDFFRTYMGNSIGAAAARLSFLLGLTGPSIATESGCSSAIVALDLAVKSLRNGESNLAMAGGVNLLLHPFNSSMMEYVISPAGRCKTFDAKADGFGRAEGCGVLVLKRMSDALRDRDNIWAVIRGSAVSQEGISRSLGTPTVHCEALAMKLALEDANIRPEQVSFVETHGTGTAVGDPMEVAAIAKAYYSPHRKEPLVIGSVKTNVGHTESCSGITGIMKAVLALQHELIPKHLNLETLNPEIFLDSIPAMIPLEPVPWPKVKEQPRICGVSSFGITGTDGHVIIQEAPDNHLPKFTVGMERPKHIVTISGKTGEALEDLLKSYENVFCEDSDIRSIAFTANTGRACFGHRAFLIAENCQDAKSQLESRKYSQGQIREGHNNQICFLFTGQGSQYSGMAKLLYSTSPVFRMHFDACDRTLNELYNLSIRKVLWEEDPQSKTLSRTIYSQTSIFCVEYCLFKLWESWGIKPDYVLGHSLGEFCAAVAAQVISFEDALKLVAERSLLIDSLPTGSMLVIKASKQQVETHLKQAKIYLDFAAINNPEQTVVAGDTEKVEQFLEYLKNNGVKAIILDASHAFHSAHMDPILEKYRQVASTIQYKPGNPSIQYISGMEGRVIDDLSEIDSTYWVRHTREKVSFMGACAALKEAGCQDFLEVGPQPILSSFVMINNEGTPLNCFPSLRRNQNDWDTILTSLGKLYLLGYQIDWKSFDDPYVRNKVSLPFHPFHRKSYWVECTGENSNMIHPLIGYSLKNASALNIFQNDLVLKSVPYLKDHCIGNRVVFPGAGFTEMSLSAGFCVANALSENFEQPTRAITLQNLRVEAPMELKDGKACRLQVLVDLPENESTFRVKIFHQNANDNEESGKWVLHASSTFVPVASTRECLSRWKPERISEIISTVQSIIPEKFYKLVADHGLKFGDHFRMLQRFWTTRQQNTDIETDEVVSEIPLPDDWNKYLLHPLIIDAVFQTGILTKYNYQESKLKVPISLGEITRFSGWELEPDLHSLFLYAWYDTGKYCLFISTPTWKPVAYVQDVELLDTTVRTIESVLEQQSSSVPDAWEEVWKPISSPFKTAVDIQVDALPIAEKMLYEIHLPEEDALLKHQIESVIYLYILKGLLDLGWKPSLQDKIRDIEEFCANLKILPGFHQLVRFYFTALQKYASLLSYNSETNIWTVVKLPPSLQQITENIDHLQSILFASKFSTVARIHHRLAQNLVKVLTGQESALALLFPQEPELQPYSAEVYYLNHPGRQAGAERCTQFLYTCLETSFALNNQNQGKVFRVLEVGAGTGSLSVNVLDALSNIMGTTYEYYYTDISASFFAKAEKRFEKHAGNIKFATFNLEQSPLSQGIPLEYFDLVVATDVLHATRNLRETLSHLRQCIRPRGTMYFTDTLQEDIDITFIFGLLDGYWRFEDFQQRPYHCCVSGKVWQNLLVECGFEEAYILPFYDGVLGCITTMTTDCTGVEMLTGTGNVLGCNMVAGGEKEWVLFANQENVGLMRALEIALEASGYKAVVVKGEDLNFEENGEQKLREVIGGGNLHGVVYGLGMTGREWDQRVIALPFLHIAKILVGMVRPPQLYVLTQGNHPIVEDTLLVNPAGATLWGMAKSLKNELVDGFVRCVDFEQGCAEESVLNQLLFEITKSSGLKESLRVQVAYRDHCRFEPRMVKALVHRAQQDDLKLPPCTDRYHLVLPKSRLIQDLEFEAQEEQLLGEEEVEVKIKAYALNFKDVLTILKPSAEFENLNAVGLDFAGVVTKVGGAYNELKVGDRVFGANFKNVQLPSHLVTDGSSLMRMSEGLSFSEAATMPAVFLTAWYCLVNVARLGKADTVLIHTASGGVGLAALQIAKHIGARIIATAGNPRKRAYLRNLGIEHVFHSRDTSYEQDILRVTNGRGVNVVLNSITGPGIKEATLRATSANGRWVEMSKLSTWTVEEVMKLRPDVDYQVIDLTTVERSVCAGIFERIGILLKSGILGPIPYVKFDALALRQALQYFQKARHIGKVVVTMPEVALEQGQFTTKVQLFNSDSCYLITGGLGGIGFEVCKWMVEQGATDIVLMGRSPPKPEVQQQIEAYWNAGVNITVKLGDVGNFLECQAVLEKITKEEKPLRGVMHCAGVLRDNLYANQSWSDFEASFIPKVYGTQNLHKLTLGCPLEYFVVYSSVAALAGTPGQPNHAAANCFEDAFIHYRHSLGLPGTAINWGQWAQVGVAKDMNIFGVLPVSYKRMLNGLEVTLRTQKRQVTYSEFDSFSNLAAFCITFKGYLDERLWKQSTSEGQAVHNLNAEQFWRELDGEEGREGKTEVMKGYLKNILRGALRLEQDEVISDDANLQELGVDSLMMIELKNSVQSLLGSRVVLTTGMLKNCNTVRLLANVVVDQLGNQEMELAAVDPLPEHELRELLEKDVVLPEDVQVVGEVKEAVKAGEIRSVLVTGATGYFGKYLVARLSRDYGNIEKIYCLVRGNQLSGPEKLEKALETVNADQSKVECIVGDVTIERFGLEEEKYVEYCRKVDAVIHCAAKMNPGEHLRKVEGGNGERRTDCRSVNLEGTLNVLRFASSGQAKHVYYPSTLVTGAFNTATEEGLPECWPEMGEVDTYINQKIPGVQTCKFLVERLMHQANERGVPCKVFRFPWISGERETGKVELESMYILRFLSYLKVGAMPAMVIPGNFMPVDLCAELSLKVFLSDLAPCEVYNLCHPKPDLEQEFGRVAQEEFGKQLEILEWNEFQERVAKVSEENGKENGNLQDNKMITHYFAEAAELASGYIKAPDTYFGGQKVSRLIEGYGEDFEPTIEILRRDLRYLKGTGLLEKLGF